MDHLFVGEEALCQNRHIIPVAPLFFTMITLYAASSFRGFGFARLLTSTFHAEKYSTAVTPELYGGLLPLSHNLLSAMSRVH